MGVEERINYRQNDRVEEWYFLRFCIEKIYYKGKRRQLLISRWRFGTQQGLGEMEVRVWPMQMVVHEASTQYCLVRTNLPKKFKSPSLPLCVLTCLAGRCWKPNSEILAEDVGKPEMAGPGSQSHQPCSYLHITGWNPDSIQSPSILP